MMSRTTTVIGCLIFAFVAIPGAKAQFGGGGFGGGGFSSASVASMRAGVCPPPSGIIVEEFYNYHFHDIPFPADKEAIALDVRWGAMRTNQAVRTAYLQVGMATKREVDLENVQPLNLSFVIDCSGSMEGDRIANVKRSLLTAIKKLRKSDRVSIVTFSDEAEVIYASHLVDDLKSLELAIEGVHTTGSTNLCAGLMLGYDQVRLHFDDRHNNRVIVLTDGIANAGVTDSEEIVRKSKTFHNNGITLSTIGLGENFNETLLRQLARSGNGLIHFVADDKDIKKVFVEELDGLLSGVARDVSLTIDLPKGLEIDHIYGYSPKLQTSQLRFDLDPLNSGTTQVILIRFRIADSIVDDAELPVKVHLKYFSIGADSDVSVIESAPLTFDSLDDTPIDPLVDSSVRRNVTIADIAQGMKQMSQLLEDEKPKVAAKHLQAELKVARKRYPMALDEKVVRTNDIANGYLKKIAARGR